MTLPRSRVACDKCHGCGWVHDRKAEGWGKTCPLCHGIGWFTFYSLSGLLGEDERSIRRVYEMAPRVRTRTFKRVFDAVVAVLS